MTRFAYLLGTLALFSSLALGCATGGAPDDSGFGSRSDARAGGDGSVAPGDGGPRADGALPPSDAGPGVDAAVGCVAGSCDDGDACTSDICGADGICRFTRMACDDGDACTTDMCVDGACVTAPVTCDDGNACTMDVCSAGGICTNTPPTIMGDTCSAPIAITASGMFTGDTGCATSDVSGGCGAGDAPDVFFRLTLAAASDVTLDASGTSFDSVLSLGMTCAGGELGCDDDSAGSGAARLTRPALAAGTYIVVLDGKTGASGGPWRLSATITPSVVPETVMFPTASDTYNPTHGYLWTLGAFVQGVRSTSLPSIRSLDMNLTYAENGLTCDNQDMRLVINGIEVGRFTITPSTTTMSRTYSFAAIAGPSYTLRIENVRQVNGGCGSARLGAPATSTITLRP